MNIDSKSSIANIESCPVCGDLRTVFVRVAFDDRYGFPKSFSLVRCASCEHLMTSPRLKESDLSDLYGNYYPRKNIASRQVFEQAKRAKAYSAKLSRWWLGGDNQGQYHARSGEKVLDIGCGSGFSLLVARDLGCDVYGIDADPNVQDIARELNLKIHHGGIHDLPFPGVLFDLIILNQVIEHIPEPGLMLDAIISHLAPGGRIILVFPNVNSIWSRIFKVHWINWHIPYHLHHFGKKNFSRLAIRHGLQVVWTRTITPNLWTILQLRTVLAGSPVLGAVSPVWASPPKHTSVNEIHNSSCATHIRKFILFIAIFTIGAVNRIIDLCGLGDCLMFELKRK